MGCGGGDEPAAIADPCASPAWQASRAAFVDALGLPARRAAPGRLELGEAQAEEGFVLRGARWPHPEVDGEYVHALLYVPAPPPDAAAPLLLNVHGHWGDGIVSDEVHRRASVAARRGWVVLSLASRGMELESRTPGWRRQHDADGLYAQLRARRSGGTPVGWDVVAGWSAVDLAAAGALPVAIDLDRIVVMGFSGGSERAAAVAATDPRVSAAVVGAYEYAFSSGFGQSQCSCGVVRGAGEPLAEPVFTGSDVGEVKSGYREPVAAWRWLGLAACMPGATPRARAVLAWDSEPDDVTDSELFSVGTVERRPVPGVHGITPKMAEASVRWAEEAVGFAGRARTSVDLTVVHPETLMPLAETQPAPGNKEQGQPPWRVDGLPNPAAARRWLGLDDPEDVRGLGDGSVVHREATVDGARSGFVVVLGEDAAWERLGGLDALAAMRPDVEWAVVRHRLVDGEVVASRYGIETGQPPLGIAVRDVLAAHRALAARPGVDGKRIGFLGVGSGGLPALQAALFVGESGPIALASAPVTLFFDGPREGGVFAPWPPWMMVAGPGGATFDPWLLAKPLADRVRWLDPRGGDGAPWTAHLPHGETVTELSALVAPDTRAAR